MEFVAYSETYARDRSLLIPCATALRRAFAQRMSGREAAFLAGSISVQPPILTLIRRIGILLPAAADDLDFQAWVGAFLQAMAQLGWVIGRTLRIDTRWAGANANDIRKHATELAALAPDAILAHGTSTVRPEKVRSSASVRGSVPRRTR